MKLSEKQIKFCDYYISTGNASESYKNAGYNVSGNVAEVNASRLLRNAKVIEYIKERNDKLQSTRIADMTEVKELWTNILRGKLEGAEIKDILKASEYIAKTNAAFTDNLNLAGDINIKIDPPKFGGDKD